MAMAHWPTRIWVESPSSCSSQALYRHLDQGNVEPGVGAHQPAGHFPAVVQVHLELLGPGHHVVVGEDVAPGVDDDAGALAHHAPPDGLAAHLPEHAFKGRAPEKILRGAVRLHRHHPDGLEAHHRRHHLFGYPDEVILQPQGGGGQGRVRGRRAGGEQQERRQTQSQT